MSRVEAEAPAAELSVRCMMCGLGAIADRPVTQCTACGGMLDCELPPLTGLDRTTFDRPAPPHLAMSGVWRYRALLPAIPERSIVSRAEGRTPIYWDTRLAEFAGLQRIGLKHEGQNPTSSFKDRGMTVGISHAKSVGARVVACASTGNTSASLASYAAAAGMRALVLVPEGKIAGGKLAQTIAHGALVVQVQGDFDQALALLREIAEEYDRHHVYLVNSVNPFRIEGQKTIVFELLEQLDWAIPDVIALPGGNLGNTAAFGKALIDLKAAGLIDKAPRLVTVQAAGAAPFVAYYEHGYDSWEPVVAETIATAIKIGNPASMERARRALQLTDGIAVAVTDDEIMAAKARIDAAGIGCEPASAASLAGVRKLVQSGEIAQDATVVGVLTGHLLKDADAVIGYHLSDGADGRRTDANRPVTIPAERAALERVIHAGTL